MSLQATQSGDSSGFSLTLQLRHDEIADLQHRRQRSAQRQLREMQNLSSRPAPFIADDTDFNAGDVTIED